MVSSLAPPPQPRGVDFSLPTCGENQCHGRGTCRVPMGGGAGGLVCDCILGYKVGPGLYPVHVGHGLLSELHSCARIDAGLLTAK